MSKNEERSGTFSALTQSWKFFALTPSGKFFALTVGCLGGSALGCISDFKSQPGRDAAAVQGTPDGGGVGATDGGFAVDTIRGEVFANLDVGLGTGGPDAACAMQSAVAERLPLDLYVMMDSSGSMLDETLSGVTKWDAVKAAMVAFVNDPQSAGIGVGIQYFPQLRPNVPGECLTDTACNGFGPCFQVRTCTGTPNIMACDLNSDCPRNQTCVLVGACSVAQTICAPAGAACTGGDSCAPLGGYCLGRDNCDVAPYASPAVAIAALPGAATTLIGSLETHELDGLTPTAPAVSGAIRYAQQRASSNPNRKVAVLLVTDGFPSTCAPVDVAGIAAIAAAGAAGAAGTPGVPTFVIGVFAEVDAAAATTNLNTLAAGGGTGSAVVISTNQNVTQALQTALNQIRTTAVACEYRIPPPTMGTIDFSRVNVHFTSGNSSVTTVGYVRNRAGCDPARGGWFYDADPATGGRPTAIISCETTCNAFRADAAGRVDIVLGCQTSVIL